MYAYWQKKKWAKGEEATNVEPHIYMSCKFRSRHLPDGEEKASLQIAGLGESLFAFGDAQMNYAIHSRVVWGGKQLDVIAAPESGYTVSYLRAVVRLCKTDAVKEDVSNVCMLEG